MHLDAWKALVRTLETLQWEVEGVFKGVAAGLEIEVPDHLESWRQVQALKEMDPQTGKVA